MASGPTDPRRAGLVRPEEPTHKRAKIICRSAINRSEFGGILNQCHAVKLGIAPACPLSINQRCMRLNYQLSRQRRRGKEEADIPARHARRQPQVEFLVSHANAYLFAEFDCSVAAESSHRQQLPRRRGLHVAARKLQLPGAARRPRHMTD